jgi:DNA-binding response OmpR family regulator
MNPPRLNLGRVAALIADTDKYVLNLVTQMLRGFGLERQSAVETGAAVKDLVANGGFDLCILEASLPDISGFDVVKWIRRLDNPQIRFIPIIVLTGYTQAHSVVRARDCGANIVLKKPVSPQVLFDRIAWVAKGDRPFIECEAYVGPDRRFKSIGPPDGVGRRSTDLPPEVGAATEPNMSQDEIDSLMRPTRIVTS